MAQGNLAGNLTASAERFGDRVAPAPRRRRGQLRASSTRPARASRGCWRPRASVRATAWGSCSRTSPPSRSSTTASCALGAVVVPMNVLLKGREVSFYLRDPEAKVVLRLARLRRGRAAGRRGGGRRVRRSSSRAGSRSSWPAPSRAARCRAGRGRHRRHPLHVRHHRHAEGRRAHARQPRPQRRDRRRPVRHRRGRRRPRSAPALPLLRPDVRAERLRPRRRRADPHPALRPGQGARDHRARQGHRVRGRADDVRRRCSTAPPRDTADTRACASAPRAGRRCPSRSSAPSRRSSAARCSRATA